MVETQLRTIQEREQLLAAVRTQRHDTMTRLLLRRFMRHHLAVAGIVVLLLLALSALLAPLVAPYNPDALATAHKLEGPTAAHWFGTDDVGRDIFSRVLYGGRISLVIGLAATAVAL